MRFFASVLLTSALALATPIARRQADSVQIVSASLTGEGCPSGSFSSEISDDGKTLSYGFDDYSTNVGAGAPPNDREKTCNITLRLQFPVGCTRATFDASYHGFAQLDSGVTGSFSTQYSLSPGQLTGTNPPATVITSSSGGVVSKFDSSQATVSVSSTAQQIVTYVARTRLLVQSSNGVAFGHVSIDDATFSISQQSQC